MFLKGFLAVCILLSIPGAGAAVVAYTANRQGELDSCGCKIQDIGGLSRMAERLDQLKREHGLIFLDAGNAFFSAPQIAPSRVEREKGRAITIAKSYRMMGLRAFSPGERDFAAGSNFFFELVGLSGTEAVSANLETSGLKAAFRPFQVMNESGLRVAITGLTAFPSKAVPAGIKQRDPKTAFKNVWEAIQKEKPDQVILLSHLGKTEDEEIAKTYPGLWIIGSKSMDFYNEPQRAGKSFLFEVGIGGQRLGEIVFEKGAAGWRHAKLTDLDEKLEKPNAVANLVKEFKNKK